jgi:demethylmenaquinone methyltransferase/2-methoxy-6-polyprenyl-1,4-benzoquinol methylase
LGPGAAGDGCGLEQSNQAIGSATGHLAGLLRLLLTVAFVCKLENIECNGESGSPVCTFPTRPVSAGEVLTQRSDAPNTAEAVRLYRDHADGYDASARRTMWIRERTIAKLDLRRGDRVLDVACGTGLSFSLLREAVGPEGEVVGIEVSPEMINLARQRVTEAGWQNVTLLESSIESADIPEPLDAVLFQFTHDVMRSPAALKRIFAAAGPNARIAFAGMKYAPWWMAFVNVIVRAQARPYMTTFEGLDKPWDLALPYLRGFERRSVLFGTGYIGWGRVHKA